MRTRSLVLATLALLGTASAAFALPTVTTYAGGGYIRVTATNMDNYTYSCLVQATYTINSQSRGQVLQFKVPPNVTNTTVASFGPLSNPQLTNASTSCI